MDYSYVVIQGVSINTRHIGSIQPAVLGKGKLAKFIMQIKNRDHIMVYSFSYTNVEAFMKKYKEVCEFLGTWNQPEFHEMENQLLERAKLEEITPEKG